MDQASFIAAVTARLQQNEAIEALFLAGSFGRDTADDYSDVDLIAVADPDNARKVAQSWKEVIEEVAPIIFWNEMDKGALVLNAITVDWLRCDLSIMSRSVFAAQSRDSVKPLIDNTGLHAMLSVAQPRMPDPVKVRYLISEFIRVLGLLRVVMGRKEYFTAVTGVGLLKDQFLNLMLEEVPLADRGGMLHMSKVLPEVDMDRLMALPCPGPDRKQLITANFEVARQFLPRAFALAERIGVSWPSDFETATLAMLHSRLGEADWLSLRQSH